jgi:hypothetical protein
MLELKPFKLNAESVIGFVIDILHRVRALRIHPLTHRRLDYCTPLRKISVSVQVITNHGRPIDNHNARHLVRMFRFTLTSRYLDLEDSHSLILEDDAMRLRRRQYTAHLLSSAAPGRHTSRLKSRQPVQQSGSQRPWPP